MAAKKASPPSTKPIMGWCKIPGCKFAAYHGITRLCFNHYTEKYHSNHSVRP